MDKGADAYNQFEDWLFKVTPKAIAETIYYVPAQKQVKIRDPGLSLIEKSLMVCVLFYVIGQIVTTQEHLVFENPSGFPTIEFLRKAPNDEGFNTIRNTFNGRNSHGTLPYCTYEANDLEDSQKPYDYLKPKKLNGKIVSPVKNDNSFWTEDVWHAPEKVQAVDSAGRVGPLVPFGDVFTDNNIACKQLNYAEVIKKNLFTAQLTTFQTETLSTVYDCKDLPYEMFNGKNVRTCRGLTRESDDTTIVSKFTGE